ncbi:23S rRNA (guanine(745)-N(1))-methyltransferase [Pragia fontium]|uniref:23S rRNA m(1)G-745 methyltransferase n=1 Tax=Pragia fontium DSM 5563 = ATCC 49100 TaxID=1122977 RepID=A0AAJ4WB62_9GAMM|nr:23S rRNA (guanine(745)-N(1))-methyltransferase [Pragia fontium]AKJ42248.1 23S rRNA methyltransferase [Pragia fontium]SFC95987.1 23S rRNA m(1)G-745 methyltransferase [Pragia fontium DSM 5563 = ATCC 49100]SUB82517.1 Ribosomal RNA large subunit methyltransferase A [Pragia fontium]VEJ55418.1 Ribosomal RNA large subunit methyltransferase A [Pragia fontium]
MLYQCPICHHSLQLDDRVWCCSNHHQFDRAKEGYVNLMPVQHKKSKNPGDNQMMMQARRQFLDAGYYQPLRDAIYSLLDKSLSDHQNTKRLLDIGCGEGYYTGFLAENLSSHHTVQVHGLDIAKGAIRAAAKRYPAASFCVASSHRLPFADDSMDGVLRIYAPCKAQELSRVIKSGGFIVAVTPAPRHLIQLKGLIYQTPQPHEDIEEQIEGFHCIQQQRLSYNLTLSGEQAVNLLQMTPFAWKASEQLIQQLAEMSEFHCEADFYIRLYQK